MRRRLGYRVPPNPVYREQGDLQLPSRWRRTTHTQHHQLHCASMPPSTIEFCARLNNSTIADTGGDVTLVGNTTDPDNDIVITSWLEGPPLVAGQVPFLNQETYLGSATTLTTVSPFTPPSLQTGFSLVASDHTLQTALSQAIVTVRDTVPPALTLAATPSCLWPPNHAMVLYQLGSTLADTVLDTCDVHPKVEIVSVTSDQPALGGGSGNAAPDVITGTQAFCVRAERDGTNPSPRHYTVVVKATDASNNSTTKDVSIIVAHDQAGVACAKVPNNQLVADNDLRCSAN